MFFPFLEITNPGIFLIQKFKTLRNDKYHHKAKIVLSLGIYSNTLHSTKSKKKKNI